MEFLLWCMLLLAAGSLLFLVIGLVKPWPVLWWREKQNRIGVIKLYGPLVVIGFTGYFVLKKFLI